jgi:type III pantothenate kinase
MLLVIDAGNTRIKWGVHDGNSWLRQGIVQHHEIKLLTRIPDEFSALRHAVISSVAGTEIDAVLQTELGGLGITLRFIHAVASGCGVINGYLDPAQMGCDRWAALVAAWKIRKGACVVVSAGTAMTVDALSSRGEFLGGLIVPGLSMMKSVLAANTARILQTDGDLLEFPATTGDAVHSGALKAMAGAVEYTVASLARREARPPALMLTGGDAGVLQNALSGAGEIVDNLVLEGLVLIAKEIQE